MNTPATVASQRDPLVTDQSHPLYPLIARQPFFQGLNPHHLELLTDSALEMEFPAGQAIFQAGSPANRFYLILAGKVAIESEMKEHGVAAIRALGPGDALGWAWLFPPYYLNFSARTLEPTKTIFFYGTRLREHCQQDHEFGYQLMTRVAEVVVRNLNAMQQRLIECADPTKLSKLPPVI